MADDGVGVSLGRLASDRCLLEDLCLAWDEFAGPSAVLVLDAGWVRRWRAAWRLSGSSVVCAVRDLASVPTAGCEPVRRFSWRTGQRHRPGLQYLVSTGRHHGFESMAEQRVLLALDFVGGLVEVLGQPFRLKFATTTGWREHIPDFLAVTGAGGLLIDVRPGERIGDEDRVCFAAARRPHVQGSLDALSAQRRPLRDQLGVQPELVSVAASGPWSFGELVAQTRLPAVARAHALHLIWHRRLGIDLAAPFSDATAVWASPAEVR